MKIVRASQTKEHRNSDTCIAKEYPSDEKDISGAVIELRGRYPDKGYVVNNDCKELAFVIEGEGVVATAGETQSLRQGDLALLLPGEKYYFEGNLTMFMPCSPAWYPEQHQQVAA